MRCSTSPGWIVILNGVPRSGKSSIAKVIQQSFPGIWMNLGVDAFMSQVIPPKALPAIGLRPGGERPDLEPLLGPMYRAMYQSIACHSRNGLNVVVDIGHHDVYSRPLGILAQCASCLEELPVVFVGVRCPIETIMERRNQSEPGRYATGSAVHPPAPALLWQDAVHIPGIYDLEVDTSLMNPDECAKAILERMNQESPLDAFQRAAKDSAG